MATLTELSSRFSKLIEQKRNPTVYNLDKLFARCALMKKGLISQAGKYYYVIIIRTGI